MISFFRKIRYRIAHDNSPKGWAGQFLKYSKYALCEIICWNSFSNRIRNLEQKES